MTQRNPEILTVTAAQLEALAERLQAKTDTTEWPHGSGDLRIAAAFLRHALRVGWVTTSVAITLTFGA